MNPQRWRRITRLLDQVLALPAEDRSAWLDQHCRGANADLRDDLERLIRADQTAGDFLSTPPLPQLADQLLRDEPVTPVVAGRMIGPYRILEEIGRGGMGTVYLAERSDGQFEQLVALKLLRDPGRGQVTRFLRERQILAGLKHANIARLCDGGVTADGLPYIAMEHVDGVPLTDYCSQQKLGLDERLAIFIPLCHAVHFAHQNLVVHRDIKPANVMVDQDGTPKLLDFGVAKLLGDAESTLTQSRVLTPDFAAPEQVLGQAVTTAVDVYALGMLLYELLTGQRPYTLSDTSPESWARVISKGAIVRPSAMIRNAAGGKAGNWSLKGDLDVIILTALQRDPARRYASAQAFGDDLQRCRLKLPIAARADSLPYLLQRSLRRHWVGALASSVVMLALVGGTAIAVWQADNARAQTEIALQSKSFLLSLLLEANPVNRVEGVEYLAVDLLREAARRAESEMTITPALQAEVRLAIASSLLGLGEPSDARLLAEKGLEQLREAYGPVARELAEGLYIAARIEVHLGAADSAEMLAREALAILERLNVGPDILVIRLLGMLARANNVRGLHEEALGLYEQSLALRIDLSGPDDASLASIYNNIGTTGILAEDYVRGEAAYRQAGRLLLQDVDPEHANMAFIHQGIGTALMGQGRLMEADVELGLALRIATRRHGAGSNRLASIYTNLGRLRRAQARLDESRDFLAHSVHLAFELNSVYEELAAGAWLGIVMLELGEVATARNVLERCRSLMETLGHQSTARYGMVEVALGLALARQGHVAEGDALAQTGLAGMLDRGQTTSKYYTEAESLFSQFPVNQVATD